MGTVDVHLPAGNGQQAMCLTLAPPHHIDALLPSLPSLSISHSLLSYSAHQIEYPSCGQTLGSSSPSHFHFRTMVLRPITE